MVGRSFFSPQLGGKGELGNGIEYWMGYYQSLRPTQMGLSLNIGSYSMIVVICLLQFCSQMYLMFFSFQMSGFALQMCLLDLSMSQF